MGKNLVAYFSYSGNAKKIAKMVSEVANAELYEIIPQVPYSSDYQECVDQARQEISENARPVIAGEDVKMEQFDRIILVFPNWCSTCPMIVLSFVEKYDMKDKVIDVIVTNGGGGVGNSQSDIAVSARGAVVNPGINGNTLSENVIQELFGN